MSDFQVGDVVVCVDDGPCGCGCGDLMNFSIGQMDRIDRIWVRSSGVYFDSPHFGTPSPNHPARGVAARRFRKLPKADDSFIQQILACKPHHNQVPA